MTTAKPPDVTCRTCGETITPCPGGIGERETCDGKGWRHASGQHWAGPEDGRHVAEPGPACPNCGKPVEPCTDCEGDSTGHAVHTGSAIRWHACAAGGTVAEFPPAPSPRPSIREVVSGRSEPRPSGDVKHDVRFYGALTGVIGTAAIAMAARCEPCTWSVSLDGGHSAGELVRLAEQHCGVVTA